MSIEFLYQWTWQCKHGNKATDKPYKKMYTHLNHGRISCNKVLKLDWRN